MHTPYIHKYPHCIWADVLTEPLQAVDSRDCQTYSGQLHVDVLHVVDKVSFNLNNACRKERRVREREEGKNGGNKGRRSLLLVFYTNGEDNHPGFTTLNQENITVHQHKRRTGMIEFNDPKFSIYNSVTTACNCPSLWHRGEERSGKLLSPSSCSITIISSAACSEELLLV